MDWDEKDEGLKILLDALYGNKNAIEDSEARGQKDAIKNKRLPIKANAHSKDIETPEEKYKAMGIKIISKHNEYFYNVELPENMDIIPTEHTMWNQLIKDGEVVATFFFKASVYDYDAFINFER